MESTFAQTNKEMKQRKANHILDGLSAVLWKKTIFSATFCAACSDLFCKRAQALRNSRLSSAGSTRLPVREDSAHHRCFWRLR